MSRYCNLVKNIANWPHYFMVKFGFSNEDPVMFVARNDVKIEVPRRLFHEFKEIFFDDAYFIGQKKEITNTEPIFIDIGANVGFFTLFAAARYPDASIYAYEPVGVNFKELSRNKELNSSRNINCYNMAICGHKGEISLNFDTEDSFTTSATIFDGTEQGVSTVKVPCLRLQDIFEENGINRCDFLKLDCEGAEFQILYNSPKEIIEKIDQVAMEVHEGPGDGENMEGLISFFTEHGFNAYQLPHNPNMLWAHR